jgi:hypothetical protein
MMALNMLRRWLNGQPVASEHGWINVVESSRVSHLRAGNLSRRAVSPACCTSLKNSVR